MKILMMVMMMIHLLCFLLSSFFTFAILDPIDFLSLQSIRNSLADSPGSNYFSSWDFTSDPCNFPGVYCDSDKIIALNLGDPSAGSPGLTGRLHPAIGNLSSLAEFTVVPGRIIGTLPNSISQLKNLRFLGISRNFISGDIPASLGQIQGLPIPFSIGTLPALSNLILNNNRLSGSVPPFSSQSQTLTRLDLKYNNLSGSISSTSLPSSLQYLSLSWNRLEGPVDRILTGLNSLNYLDLSMNRFTGSIPASVFSFPITNLQLQRNSFSGPVQPVDQVTIPTNLYLNNNRFTGQVPGSLVDRLMEASIQILYLQHNFLTGIEINPTAEIPLSSSLCLQYNCMVPPVQTPCPLKAGMQKTRPTDQCIEWRG
ncbi:hypothetical protein CsSME_00047211 [Camellia sinensis var. sinensis]